MSATSARRRACRGEERREEILRAAADVFLERGYAGATMDAVVERSGGSKETIYSHFGSKEGLFSAIIETNARRLMASLDTPPDGGTLDEILRAIARNYLENVLSPRSMALYRLVVGECGRSPVIGDIFYRMGPESFAQSLGAYFARMQALGQIRADLNPFQLASVFRDTLRGDLHLRETLNPTRVPTALEIARHADAVVDLFARAVRPDTASQPPA